MGSRARSKQILSIYRELQLIFSSQVIKRQPGLGYSYFTLGVLCKLKGILARIRQPNANNPHLGETVHCYPSKHKLLLVTHSKQKWPVRDERPALDASKASMLLSKSHSLSSPTSWAWPGHCCTPYGKMSLAWAIKEFPKLS